MISFMLGACSAMVLITVSPRGFFVIVPGTLR